MVNTIYLLSFVDTPRKFIIAIINLRGVSTKLNKYKSNLAVKCRLCEQMKLIQQDYYTSGAGSTKGE